MTSTGSKIPDHDVWRKQRKSEVDGQISVGRCKSVGMGTIATW